MNDPANLLVALVRLGFPPLMLLAPLVCVLFVRARGQTPAVSAEIRGKKVMLAVATAFCLLLWLGCTLQTTRSNAKVFAFASQFAWVLFFPLWFLLAMPIVRVTMATPVTAGAPTAEVRVASLVSRARKHPIPRGLWTLCATLWLAGLAAIGTRWFGGPFATDAARNAFLWQLASHAFLLALNAFLLPFCLRRMLLEPEPLDAHGSPELQRMYDELRASRIKSLFWVLGVAMPAMFALAFAIVAWTGVGEIAGWIGAIGGTAVGLGGATIGALSGLRRMRIAEFKQRLDQQTSAPPRVGG